MPSSVEYQRAWRAKNPGYHARKQREYYAAHPERIKRQNLKANYGLTIEQYRLMYAQQEGRCANCEEHRTVLCVDHSHSTGAIRELLCSGCNSALGFLKEDVGRIERLAAYVRKHTRKQP